MSYANFRMLIYELLKNYPDIVPEETPLDILDSKSAIFISKNGKDTNHPRHISRRVNSLRNGEKWKIYKIDWCERGMQLADIAAKNIDEND